jgi:hypothetical protein
MYANNAVTLSTSALRASSSANLGISNIGTPNNTSNDPEQTGLENAKQTVNANLDADARAMVELGETLPG